MFISVIFFCNLEYLHILNIVDLDRLHLVDHCVLSFQNRPWHCVRVRIQMPNEWPYAVSLVPFTTSNVVSHPHNCSFFPILHHLNQLHFHPFSIYFPIIGPAFWYVHLILLSSLRLAFFTSWWQTFVHFFLFLYHPQEQIGGQHEDVIPLSLFKGPCLFVFPLIDTMFGKLKEYGCSFSCLVSLFS